MSSEAAFSCPRRHFSFSALVPWGLALSITVAMSVATASPAIPPYNLWVMGGDGREEHRLIGGGFSPQRPEWSPDGTRIVEGSSGQLVVVDVRSGSSEPIPDSFGLEPSWAPDGASIVYARNVARSTFDLYVTDPENGDPQPLFESARSERLPRWSPDGESIAFIRSGTRGGLFVKDLPDALDTAPSPAMRLVGGIYHYEEWSPASDRILWADAGIWTVNRDGSGVAKIADHYFRRDYSPAWSPDGNDIAYCVGGAIFLMRPDGTEKRKVTTRQGCGGLSWHPEGTRIAFLREHDIWSVRPDGSGLQRLTRTGVQETTPSWSPDGEHIAYYRR